ncbi:VanZ family protein [Haloarcula marina]|uniref:VanZ family protein n=1 Tax=Haloarcula marina TaxID=2961574 RepID=UPI0020B820A4|nr:VanZ family protein [Halomicroarcula marina]
MSVRLPLLPRWLRWGAVAAVGAFIFYASILTVPPETVVDTAKPELLPLDKWRHFVAYATLAATVVYATADRDGRLRWVGLLLAGVALYGIGIEFGQSFLPSRYFSLGDAYANALGAVLVSPWFLLRRHVEFRPVRAWLPDAVTHSS